MNTQIQQNFSPKLMTYLKALGYKEEKVRVFTYDIKFFHDLGFMGDTADECMVILNDMGVDMTDFSFEDYFPPEFHDRFILNFLPIPEKFLFKKDKYKPLTLGMIEKVLNAGNWSTVSKKR